MSIPPSPRQRRSACPLCGKQANVVHAPFCSQGCRDRDLLKWLGDGYRIPGRPAEGLEDDAGAPTDDD